MQLQARLVHAEPGCRVVEVSAHGAEGLLGSALGEAATAEEAEDRAATRLRARLGNQAPLALSEPEPSRLASPRQERSTTPGGGPAAAATEEGSPAPQLTEAVNPGPPAAEPAAPAPRPESGQEPPADPEDWSGELAQIDLQLRRLGWQRSEESTYLERAFHHPSRNRLTTYADLQTYLQALQKLEAGSDPASVAVPLRRRDLLEQCEVLLRQLGWDASQGRQFLERQFEVSSRQQLSDTQLLQFNMLLEGELIGV
jgi:hypothetical protein